VGIGLGGYYLNLTVLETSAVIARSFNKLHVAAAIDVDAITFQVNPGVIVPAQTLTVPNGTIFVRWPTLTNSRQRWGVGGHFGIYYGGHGNWHFGAMGRTPVDFHRLRWDSTDILGQFQPVSIPFSLPAYVGFGVSYTGIRRWTFAADYKYAFYDSARFLGDAARFKADGSANGLGYKNSSVVNIGIQYDVSEKIQFRTGVKINTEVLDARDTTFNLSAGILKYSPAVGITYNLDAKTALQLSYVRGIAPDLGPAPIVSPTTNQPIPGTSVTSQLGENNIIIGVSRRF
jgi:long-subunit fatty acid transport protein